MKHIFGMAKSHLDTVGGKSRSLELDFLRLLYAVEHHNRLDDSAHGYLVVLDDAVAQRVASWLQKYDAEAAVTCVTCRLGESELAALREEKVRNAAGARRVRAESVAAVTNESSAELGRSLGERELKVVIQAAEPFVQETHLRGNKLPFGIQWDFYGTVETREEASNSALQTDGPGRLAPLASPARG